MSTDQFIELRGEVPREFVDVMDAVAQANPGASRMSVLREILADWYDRKVHEHSLIERVRRGNGSASESERSRPELERNRNGSRTRSASGPKE